MTATHDSLLKLSSVLNAAMNTALKLDDATDADEVDRLTKKMNERCRDQLFELDQMFAHTSGRIERCKIVEQRGRFNDKGELCQDDKSEKKSRSRRAGKPAASA